MIKINCSVVIVSRERPKRLKGCIVKIYEKAKYPDTVECLVRIDEDDKDTIHMFKTDKDFRKFKNLRVFVGQRVGFDYLWLLFKHLFKKAKGDIIIPLSDDLYFTLQNWDEVFYTYKDESAVLSWKARVVLTKKIIEQDAYVRNWSYSSPRGDQDIWRYAITKGFHIEIPNWYEKVLPEEEIERFKIIATLVLGELKWNELYIS